MADRPPFVSDPQVPPGKPLVRAFPTPDIRDQILVVKKDSRAADFQVPAPGSSFDGLDPDNKLAAHVFAKAIPRTPDPGWTDLYFLAERFDQEKYNIAERTFPWVSADYPRITRTSIVLRDAEVQPTALDLDPENPELNLVSYTRTRSEDPVVDALFVQITQVYERLPGPTDYATDLEPAAIPYPLRNLVPATTVTEFQSGPATEASAEVITREDEWGIKAQTVSAFKRAVSRIKRIIPPGGAFLTFGRKLTRQGQIGVETVSWKVGAQNLDDTTALTEDAEVADFGQGTTAKTTLTVPRVFPDSEYSIEIPDGVPPEFRTLVPTLTEGQTSAGLAVPPTIGVGEIAETQKQLTEFQKRIQITKRDPAALPATLVDQETSEAYGFGGVMEVERTLAATALSVDQGIGVTDSKVKNLGNSLRLRETTAVKGSQPTLKLTAGGSGYTAAPIVSFSGGSSGGGATAVASIVPPVAPTLGAPIETNLDHDDDGDENGVFFHLGKRAGNGTWVNPHTAGGIIVRAPYDTLQFNNFDSLVNRQPSNTYLSAVPGRAFGQSFEFDLGEGRTLVPDRISYRARAGYASYDTGFTLQGSNVGTPASWVSLETLDDPPTTPDEWASWAVGGSTPYRYFRLIRADAETPFHIGEVELYGQLSEPAESVGGTAGYVSGIAVTAGGNYRTPPTVKITGGGGSGAKAEVIMNDSAIEAVELTNPGSGYTSEPAVTFVGGTLALEAAAAVSFLGKAVQSVTITDGGSGYRWAPSVRITSVGGKGGGAAGVATIGFGIGSVELLTPGESYETDPDVVISGDGTGATAEVVRGYGVESIAVGLPGSGYASPPGVVFGGDGSGASANARLGFGVTAVNVTSGGSGYAAAPAVVFTGDGTGAAGTATLSRSVDSATITDGGSSYETNPAVSFSGGGGTGAEGEVVRGFGVDTVEIDNPGSGYTSAPGVVFGGDGADAAATATLGYTVASVIVTNGGSGYTDEPDVLFGGDGDFAEAFSVLGFGVDSVTLTDPGSGYTSAPNVAINGTGTGATAEADMEGEVTSVSIVSGGTGYTVAPTVSFSDGPAAAHALLNSDPFDWVSGGDTNGILYFSGTNYGAAAWSNPHTAGRVRALRSDNNAGSGSDHVDRTDGNTSSSDTPNSWISIDFGASDAAHTVVVSDYAMQNRGGGSAISVIRNWKLQGSNNVAGPAIADINAATWVDLDTRVNDTTLPQEPSAWGHWTLGTAPAAYRWIRILQNDVNAGGTHYLEVAEIEIYGTLAGLPVGAVRQVVVDDPGSGYSDAPDVTLTGDGTGATAVANMAITIAGVTVTAPGSGYTSTPTVAFTGGGGTGATATAVLETAGAVKSITLVNPGEGYTTVPPVTFSGGGGTDAAATANLSSTGNVKSIAVTDAGSGYTTLPPVTFSGGGGVNAAASATLESGGAVKSITILDGGSGYTSVPAIAFAGGGGTGATATAVLASGGSVAGVVITAAGSGYSEAPEVSFTGAATTAATAIAGLAAIGAIKDITVVEAGSGFTNPPPISFSGGGGSGATATATLGSVGILSGVMVTDAGSGYSTASAAVSGGGGTGATARVVLALTGSVKSVAVTHPGSGFRSTPAVTFSGGYGTGAAGTAVLAASGTVVEVLLTTDGVYAVAPVVVFTPAAAGPGSGAAALYILGNSDPWPTLYESHVDEVTGININAIKNIVPAGTRYPADGSFTDLKPLDKWRSIQIVSSIDLATLPSPEISNTMYPLHLPDRLISIHVVWNDTRGNSGAVNVNESGKFVTIEASSTTVGEILVKRQSGFNGPTPAEQTRTYYLGPPATGSVPAATIIQGSSGTAAIFSVASSQALGVGFQGRGDSSGSRKTQQLSQVTQIPNVLTGGYFVVGETIHTAAPVVAAAGNFTDGAVSQTLYPDSARLVIDLPTSTPSIITPGTVLTFLNPLEKWRFGLFVQEVIRVTVPSIN